MADKKQITVGVLTSGGDAPGMNAAIRSVVRYGIKNGMKIMGIRRGYAGLLAEEISELTTVDVAECINHGGTILYTARCKEFHEPENQFHAVEILKKYGIDALVVIGGDGSYRGARDLSKFGMNVIGIPATIDLDIPCTDYTIGFDTAVNTAMEAIDKIRDTSTSHARCSVIEVMGRHAGYIALWCGIASGAEDILLPEHYDGDESVVINRILETRSKGKSHFIVVNAEGVGDSEGLAKRIEAATGIESRAAILGYLQRGGSPSCKDRVYASLMGAKAIEIIAEGKRNRLVCVDSDRIVDRDIDEALAMSKNIDYKMYMISRSLNR